MAKEDTVVSTVQYTVLQRDSIYLHMSLRPSCLLRQSVTLHAMYRTYVHSKRDSKRYCTVAAMLLLYCSTVLEAHLNTVRLGV